MASVLVTILAEREVPPPVLVTILAEREVPPPGVKALHAARELTCADDFDLRSISGRS